MILFAWDSELTNLYVSLITHRTYAFVRVTESSQLSSHVVFRACLLNQPSINLHQLFKCVGVHFGGTWAVNSLHRDCPRTALRPLQKLSAPRMLSVHDRVCLPIFRDLSALKVASGTSSCTVFLPVMGRGALCTPASCALSEPCARSTHRCR